MHKALRYAALALLLMSTEAVFAGPVGARPPAERPLEVAYDSTAKTITAHATVVNGLARASVFTASRSGSLADVSVSIYKDCGSPPCDDLRVSLLSVSRAGVPYKELAVALLPYSAVPDAVDDGSPQLPIPTLVPMPATRIRIGQQYALALSTSEDSPDALYAWTYADSPTAQTWLAPTLAGPWGENQNYDALLRIRVR